MLFFLPAVLPLLEALFARAAVGGVAEGIAGKATQVAGSKLFSGFVESKVAKGSTRVFRGVAENEIAKDFAAPPAGVPALKTYHSSRSVAEKAAGANGQVFSMDLAKKNLSAYAPTPTVGKNGQSWTQYSVPHVEHAQNAQMVMANPFAAAGRSGRSGGQSQGGGGLFGHLKSFANGAAGGGFSGFSGRQPAGSSGGFGGFTSSTQNLYHGVRNLAAWRPTPPPAPPVVQPYNGGGPSYPSISPSNLMGMAGQSQGQIAGANAANASQQSYQVQQAQSMKALNEIIGRVKDSFKNLLFHTTKAVLLWGSGIGPYTLGRAVTATTGSVIESDIEQHKMFNSAFAHMDVRRQLQSIQLSRETSSATQNSAEFLNDSNMEGERQLNEIWRDIKPLLNTGLGLVQSGSNMLVKLADYTSLLPLIRRVGILVEEHLGPGSSKANMAHALVEEVRLRQKEGKRAKDPIQGIK